MKDSNAFPFTTMSQSDYSGLTKREYFAALAMQAILSSITMEHEKHSSYIASSAVKHADALIKQLNQELEP